MTTTYAPAEYDIFIGLDFDNTSQSGESDERFCRKNSTG